MRVKSKKPLFAPDSRGGNPRKRFIAFQHHLDHYKFGQIVITNFADALNGSKSVEDAMAVAQTQAEELAARIQ
jgi:hypothetical protein